MKVNEKGLKPVGFIVIKTTDITLFSIKNSSRARDAEQGSFEFGIVESSGILFTDKTEVKGSLNRHENVKLIFLWSFAQIGAQASI